MRGRSAWYRQVVVLVSALLALTACASLTPAQPGSKPPDKVVFGIVNPNAGNWPAQIGVAKGLFAQNNIDFDLVRSASSVEASAALVGGSMQFTTNGVDAAIPAQQKAPEMKQVILGFDKLPYNLFTRPDITSPEQLKGKTCGGSALKTADAGYIRMMLREYNLIDERDYTIVVIGAAAANKFVALQNKQVDCITAVEPERTALLKAGMKELLRASEMPNLREFPWFSVIAMENWYGANPTNRDVAVRTTMGWLQAVRWLYDPKNKDEALSILMKNTNVDRESAESAYGWVADLKGFPADGRITATQIQRVMEVKLAMGDMKPPLPTIGTLLDTSLVDEAVKRLDAKK